MLKDLKLGLGHETLLKMYHPRALEIYNMTTDLKMVFDPKNLELGVFKVFYPIKPMLAGKLNLAQIREFVKEKSDLADHIYVETKFDGERIQVHYSMSIVQYYSRNGHDVSQIYGPKLSPVIKSALVSTVSECILDGEIVVWDLEKDKQAPFGQNKHIASTDTQGFELRFLIFDILYLSQTTQSGEPILLQRTLKDRKFLLDSVIKPKSKQCQVVHFHKCERPEQVLRLFEEAALDRGEEGLILKDPNSKYIPTDRSQSFWIKLKTDYIDQLGDSVDLVILGGYYGKRQTEDSVNRFLMGIRQGSKCVPCVKVGSGLSVDELENL